MPTTRRQTAIQEGKIKEDRPPPGPKKRVRKEAKASQGNDSGARKESEGAVNSSPEPPRKKRATSATAQVNQGLERRHMAANLSPVSKRAKTADPQTSGSSRMSRLPQSTKPSSKLTKLEEESEDHISLGRHGVYKTGTIERGHIYFFYRPKVQLEEAHSVDDVKNFYILLIPRPPAYASEGEHASNTKCDPSMTEEAELKVLSPGSDAVPAPVTRRTGTNQYHRLILVGKKKLPDPHTGQGHGRKEMFWALVTSVGDDLRKLAEGLGPKSYETKTRGTRNEVAARLVGRGGYAIVNTDSRVPSERETHLGYHISHPSCSDMGDVQLDLGIHSSSTFVIQVKNPLAPSTAPQMMHAKQAEYPPWIMDEVFGAGSKDKANTRGREKYGLRFASCETPELLDQEGAQLLMIASREGEQGLEISLGDGRGEALAEAEDEESRITIDSVFNELGLDSDVFTKANLEGEWA